MDDREKDIFYRGIIEGMTLFAWWKDGVQYVGTSGRTLKEAKQNLIDGKYDKQIYFARIGN